MTIKACSLAAKRLKEAEAEEAYRRENDECILDELFKNWTFKDTRYKPCYVISDSVFDSLYREG